jgi:hypothetical protein
LIGRLFSQTQAVIAAGTAVSGAVYIGGELVAIQLPSGWTAASMTFAVSFDGVTYYQLQDASGNTVTIPSGALPTGAAAQIALSTSTAAYGTTGPAISPIDFRGAQFVKIQSGTSGSPVNQVSAITLNLIVRRHFA